MPKYKQYKVPITTDLVVFSVVDDELKVLVVRRKYPPFKDQLALPGGFMVEGEDLHQCAARELRFRERRHRA